MVRNDGNGDSGKVQYEGYCVDLAESICKRLGIECALRLVEDGVYGEKTENGTWNGMVGELTRKVRLCYHQQHGQDFVLFLPRQSVFYR